MNLELEYIKKARKNIDEFKWLYDKYFERIFRFVFRRTDRENLTADITSQVFLKAMQNLKKYDDRGVPFSAWLYKIAENEVKRHFRDGSRVVFSMEEELLKEIASTDDDEITDERLEALTIQLERLSTIELEILQLRYFEGHDFQEISYILDISLSGAKMRAHRALEKLRKHFNSVNKPK